MNQWINWNGHWTIVSLTVILNKPWTCIPKTNISGLCVGGLGCFSVEWFWPRSTSRRPLALNGSLPWESPLSNAQLSSTSSGSGWWVKESRPPFNPSALTRPPSLCRARAALANSVWEAECVLWRCLLNSCCFFSTNKTLLLLQKQVKFDDHSMLLALFRMLDWAVLGSAQSRLTAVCIWCVWCDTEC